MKINKISILILLLATIWCGYSQKLSMKVGTNPTQINGSAALEVESTTKGFLLPRMTSLQRNNIVTPSLGLQVYDTNTNSVWYFNGTVWINSASFYIPTAQYPTFDSSNNNILNGALWVGFDATLGVWKYNKQASGRGITDPGNPNAWTVNGTTIGVFNGDFTKLPSGTHINFKYDPTTFASIYNQDDIAVRVGNLWVDKYEARIIDVSTGTLKDNDNGNAFAPLATDIRGNGQAIPNTWMSFSQRNNGSSGMSWYVAQVACGNNGKRLLTNVEWQLAAAGTSRTDATGMTAFGENWSTVNVIDVSYYGVVGCVGSLWEWVADMGQYGPTSGVAGGQSNNQSGGDDQINVNGIAYTNNLNQVTSTSFGNFYNVLTRGGAFNSGSGAGVFSLNAVAAPTFFDGAVGFRGVR